MPLLMRIWPGTVRLLIGGRNIVIWLACAAALYLPMAWLARQPQEAQPARLAVADRLDECSPFQAFEGDLSLTFTLADHAVVLASGRSNDVAPNRDEMKPSATDPSFFSKEYWFGLPLRMWHRLTDTRVNEVDQPAGVWGAWEAEENTHRVSVQIGGSTLEYTLVIPAGEDQCILVSGSPSAADLRRSWFGITIPAPPEPDN
jgi:hypothetical protein